MNPFNIASSCSESQRDAASLVFRSMSRSVMLQRVTATMSCSMRQRATMTLNAEQRTCTLHENYTG